MEISLLFKIVVLVAMADFIKTDQDSREDFDYENMALPTPERLINIITTPRSRLEDTDHREAKQARTTEIINGIRRSLGMLHGTPNITRAQWHRVPMHEFRTSPQHIQNEGQELTVDDAPLKITRMMIFAKQVPDELNTTVSANTIYFETPTSVSKRNLDLATLHIYVNPPPDTTGEVINIALTSNANGKLLSNKSVVLLAHGHWERFDVTNLFAEWITDSNLNEGISAVGNYHGRNVIRLTNIERNEYYHESGGASREPFIKIELNNKQPSDRRKRTIDREVPLVCQPEDNEPRCCRYNFIIDFGDLGDDFNFILAPRRFNANYCMGTCPSYYLPDSANAHLLFGSNGRAPVQRCCSAHQMSPLDIVYINNDGDYVQGKLDDMTIDRCRCVGS